MPTHWGTVDNLGWNPRYDAPYATWSPSTSIADAWEVVEKIPGRYWEFVRLKFDDGFVKWIVRDANDDGQGGGDDGQGGDIEAGAPTAPLAICRAALKAVPL
jgi:hypothetical protein